MAKAYFAANLNQARRSGGLPRLHPWDTRAMATPELSPIIDIGQLHDLEGTADLDLVICDCRAYLDQREGLDAYRAGHIPQARFVDLETVLSAPPQAGTGGGRHPLAEPAVFAAGLGRLGIGHASTVVAYDDAGGAIAARLVWMLRTLGQPAAILDGGIGVWDGELETGEPSFVAVEHAPRDFPRNAMATREEVGAALEAGHLVVDSRGPERYRGEVEPLDAIAGHIPGATNLPFAGNLDSGQMRPTTELRQRFASINADPATIYYCGSGVTACHNMLVAEALGIGRGRLYVGSWSGWIDLAEPSVETAF